MSDLHLSETELELYARTRRTAKYKLQPIADVGEPGRVNRPLVKALADHGLLARLFDDDASAIALCLIREALARHCTEAETAFALQGLGAYPLVQAGSQQLKNEWIPPVQNGTAIAAFALTEPEAGSDPRALQLNAEPDDGGYRLTGEKRQMLAPHAIGSLTFDGVPATGKQLLGEPGAGFRVAMQTLDLFRPSVGAFAIGMARAALDMTVRYTRARETFGKPLAQHQAVAHTLGQLEAETTAARLLVHQAARAHDQGQHDPALAAMAKLLATETAQRAVDAAVQFHGAIALERGHPLEHLYRDVRAPRIYEGASEIQREIIARAIFRRA